MPVEYEGFRILQCPGCGGHLVSVHRLESIKRVDRKTWDELEAEAASDFKGSSAGVLQCPACLLPMRKRSADLPALTLHTDVCLPCALVWLDGGELALIQLAYQSTDQFMDAQEHRRRMQELDACPERKARFEKDLAGLPGGEHWFEGALDAAVNEAWSHYLRHAAWRRL